MGVLTVNACLRRDAMPPFGFVKAGIRTGVHQV